MTAVASSAASSTSLHIGTFTPEGTFDAAIAHLGHLVDLGVDVVEVMPVAAFGGTHGWGYDGVAPYAVQQAYGGPAAFQRFVDACHGRGLGVCLDVVYNHLGPTGNYLAEFGPYFTDTHTTPWGPAVNLDADGSHEVRRWVVDNALRWFRDFHVDALRLDAVHEPARRVGAAHPRAGSPTRPLLSQQSLGRPLDLIAESDLNDAIMVTPTVEGGRGMTAQWDDDIHHALHVALTGETQGYYADFAGSNEAWPEGGSISVLAKTLTDAFLHDGRLSTFRGEVWGARVDPEVRSGHEFLAYLQTHDQVGNRATGDRISDQVSPGQQAIGAALYLLSPFTAMVFMGEEWRASTPFAFFTSFEEEWLAEAVRTGRRAEFAAHGWNEADVPDPQDPATRAHSVLDWSEPNAPGHNEMLHFYREAHQGAAHAARRRLRRPARHVGDLRRGRSVAHHVARVRPRRRQPRRARRRRPVCGRGRARARVVGPVADRRLPRCQAGRPRRRGPAHSRLTSPPLEWPRSHSGPTTLAARVAATSQWSHAYLVHVGPRGHSTVRARSSRRASGRAGERASGEGEWPAQGEGVRRRARLRGDVLNGRAARPPGRSRPRVSGLLDADHALLGRRGDEGAVLAEDLADGQATAAHGRRRLLGVEQPLVEAHVAVEPHGVVEARDPQATVGPDEAVPAQHRLEQRVVAGVGEDGGVQQRVVGEPVDGAHPHVVRRDLFGPGVEEHVALDGSQARSGATRRCAGRRGGRPRGRRRRGT